MNVLITLALKNLKRNKRRTISTIIGIVVSVILISFILTLIYSFQTTMIEDVKSRIGNYHIRIDQTTTHIAMKFNQMQEKIENTAISQIIGAADYETQLNNKQGIIIEGYDEIALYNRDINLIEGRMPQNEKEILSVHGEEQSKRLSENTELNNIDIIWSSNYTRAKATAKYIANNNNLPINLDSNLSERRLGNLKELGEFMKNKKTRDPSQEQLLDRKFKTSDGESAEDTKKRMTKFFDRILKEYEGKKIAVVSHGGSIKFFLLNCCKVNKDVKLVYNNEILNITSPCLLKLTFIKDELINLEQIYYES